jgi:hypothetical protein
MEERVTLATETRCLALPPKPGDSPYNSESEDYF